MSSILSPPQFSPSPISHLHPSAPLLLPHPGPFTFVVLPLARCKDDSGIDIVVTLCAFVCRAVAVSFPSSLPLSLPFSSPPRAFA